jgi:hypothetical protein
MDDSIRGTFQSITTHLGRMITGDMSTSFATPAAGSYKAEILATAVREYGRDGNKRIEVELRLDNGEEAKALYYLTPAAKQRAKEALEKLGYKGTVAALFHNQTNLIGKQVSAKVKHTERDGKIFVNVDLYPITATKPVSEADLGDLEWDSGSDEPWASK